LLDTMPGNIRITEPPGYPGMIRLKAGALKILTDSGGMQKEAYMPGVQCIILRENTGGVETVEGWVCWWGRREMITGAIRASRPKLPQHALYPTGAAGRIRNVLRSFP
jgi:UDP-GlcNAc3NAcA epimerase